MVIGYYFGEARQAISRYLGFNAYVNIALMNVVIIFYFIFSKWILLKISRTRWFNNQTGK
ncbi:MAG: hypothetical protein FJW56_07625 [Actinobacteria bacterium]|nr:hypothetical protein [Actinomycetota bacterium]